MLQQAALSGKADEDPLITSDLALVKLGDPATMPEVAKVCKLKYPWPRECLNFLAIGAFLFRACTGLEL